MDWLEAIEQLSRELRISAHQHGEPFDTHVVLAGIARQQLQATGGAGLTVLTRDPGLLR